MKKKEFWLDSLGLAVIAETSAKRKAAIEQASAPLISRSRECFMMGAEWADANPAQNPRSRRDK